MNEQAIDRVGLQRQKERKKERKKRGLLIGTHWYQSYDTTCCLNLQAYSEEGGIVSLQNQYIIQKTLIITFAA